MKQNEKRPKLFLQFDGALIQGEIENEQYAKPDPDIDARLLLFHR